VDAAVVSDPTDAVSAVVATVVGGLVVAVVFTAIDTPGRVGTRALVASSAASERSASRSALLATMATTAPTPTASTIESSTVMRETDRPRGGALTTGWSSGIGAGPTLDTFVVCRQTVQRRRRVDTPLSYTCSDASYPEPPTDVARRHGCCVATGPRCVRRQPPQLGYVHVPASHIAGRQHHARGPATSPNGRAAGHVPAARHGNTCVTRAARPSARRGQPIRGVVRIAVRRRCPHGQQRSSRTPTRYRCAPTPMLRSPRWLR
jgi:hypothetical protein